MPLPRAILFDLDDTIVDTGDVVAAWLGVIESFSSSLEGLDAAMVAARVRATADAFWADPERHRVGRQQLAASRRLIVAATFHELAMEGGPALSVRTSDAIADRLTRYREEQTRLFPGARETLDALSSSGVRLGLVTNGASEPQRAKIERFDLARHFQHVQIEGEIGFGKPEERAYRHAMVALGVEPAHAWMVGDNLEWEVAAPQRLGIFAVWHDYQRRGLPQDSPIRPDRVINNITQLLDGV